MRGKGNPLLKKQVSLPPRPYPFLQDFYYFFYSYLIIFIRL